MKKYILLALLTVSQSSQTAQTLQKLMVSSACLVASIGLNYTYAARKDSTFEDPSEPDKKYPFIRATLQSASTAFFVCAISNSVSSKLLAMSTALLFFSSFSRTDIRHRILIGLRLHFKNNKEGFLKYWQQKMTCDPQFIAYWQKKKDRYLLLHPLDKEGAQEWVSKTSMIAELKRNPNTSPADPPLQFEPERKLAAGLEPLKLLSNLILIPFVQPQFAKFQNSSAQTLITSPFLSMGATFIGNNLIGQLITLSSPLPIMYTYCFLQRIDAISTLPSLSFFCPKLVIMPQKLQGTFFAPFLIAIFNAVMSQLTLQLLERLNEGLHNILIKPICNKVCAHFANENQPQDSSAQTARKKFIKNLLTNIPYFISACILLVAADRFFKELVQRGFICGENAVRV